MSGQRRCWKSLNGFEYLIEYLMICKISRCGKSLNEFSYLTICKISRCGKSLNEFSYLTICKISRCGKSLNEFSYLTICKISEMLKIVKCYDAHNQSLTSQRAFDEVFLDDGRSDRLLDLEPFIDCTVSNGSSCHHPSTRNRIAVVV